MSMERLTNKYETWHFFLHILSKTLRIKSTFSICWATFFLWPLIYFLTTQKRQNPYGEFSCWVSAVLPGGRDRSGYAIPTNIEEESTVSPEWQPSVALPELVAKCTGKNKSSQSQMQQQQQQRYKQQYCPPHTSGRPHEGKRDEGKDKFITKRKKCLIQRQSVKAF